VPTKASFTFFVTDSVGCERSSVAPRSSEIAKAILSSRVTPSGHSRLTESMTEKVNEAPINKCENFNSLRIKKLSKINPLKRGTSVLTNPIFSIEKMKEKRIEEEEEQKLEELSSRIKHSPYARVLIL